MVAFANKAELTKAWAAEHGGNLHRQIVEAKAVYVPHLYRGGYVIRGFGYSTERIGQQVKSENAGNPFIV